jgi:hypothetical protein
MPDEPPLPVVATTGTRRYAGRMLIVAIKLWVLLSVAIFAWVVWEHGNSEGTG